MAIPGNDLASGPVEATLIGARARARQDYTIDYEDGGVALNDTSRGLLYQQWTFYIEGTDIKALADEVDPVTIYTGTGAGISEVSGTFDQNMRPAVGFVEGGVTKLQWFDSQEGGQTVTEWAGCSNPRVLLDDKRKWQSSANDILFFYLRDGALYYRQQRDRFTIERFLAGAIDELVNVGFDTANRVRILVNVDGVITFADAELTA